MSIFEQMHAALVAKTLSSGILTPEEQFGVLIKTIGEEVNKNPIYHPILKGAPGSDSLHQGGQREKA